MNDTDNIRNKTYIDDIDLINTLNLFMKGIIDNDINIIKKLKSEFFYFSKKNKIQCIIFNRLQIFKMIHKIGIDRELDDFLIKKSIDYNRISFINFLFIGNVPLPDNILTQSIISNNHELKKWIINNTSEYPCKTIEVIKILNLEKIHMNDLLNYELKSFILSNVPMMNELKKLLDYYITQNNMKPDIIILESVWRLIEIKLLTHLFNKNNNTLIINIMSNIIIQKETIYKIFDDLMFIPRDYEFSLIWELMGQNFFKIYNKDILYYFIDNIPYDIYEIIESNKNICYNILQCKKCINQENLIYDNWADVFTRGEDNTIIYKSFNKYCFELKNILNCWESELNTFNYVICPHYPTNPYTKELFDPVEFYIIILYCCRFKIKIPFIVSFLSKNPVLLHLSYESFKNKKNENYISSNYLKNYFLFLNLKYIDGDSSNNIAGKWVIDKPKVDKKIIKYYETNLDNTNFLKLLFIKLIIIQETKSINESDIFNENLNY